MGEGERGVGGDNGESWPGNGEVEERGAEEMSCECEDGGGGESFEVG